MRRLSMLMVLGLLVGSASPAFAQRNPFDDDAAEEKPAPTKEEATPAKKKKSDKKKAEEEAEESDDSAEAAPAVEPDAVPAPEPEPEPEPELEVEPPAERITLADDRGVARVRLTENYSKAELITTALILPVGLGLAIGGPKLFGEPNASMTSPRLGSIDYRLSIASHGNLRDGAPFAFGIFDIGGVAFPAAIGTFYLVSGLYLWGADEPMLSSQSVNIDHSMVGMAQTVGWTALTAGIVHTLVGREKPYAAFRRTGYGVPDDPGTNLSFVSTATALSFAMSSFAARDYSDWATRNGQSFVTSTILPYAVLYGLSATIGYSAIFGQQHYFSDIAVSALLGGLIGNLAYVAHFDGDGNPRKGNAAALSAGPTLLRDNSNNSLLGLGLNARF